MISLAADRGRFERVDVDLIEGAAAEVLRHAEVVRGRLSIAFLDDDAIRTMNRDYLERDGVTDVISFALHEVGEPLVGDVYIGFEQAERQSQEHGVDLEEELIRLTVHGVLHVLGHDHPDADREASAFFVLQERLVETIRARGASRGE